MRIYGLNFLKTLIPKTTIFMKLRSFSLILIIGCYLSGCAVYSSHHPSWGTFDPGPSTNFLGKISYEPGGDYISYMKSQCSRYGGLDMNSISDTSTGILMNNFGLVKEYRCKGLPKNSTPITLPNQVIEKINPQAENQVKRESNGISMSDAQNKCRELGFNPKTEGFGKCVLQLTK
jgi:hypothetical protein